MLDAGNFDQRSMAIDVQFADDSLKQLSPSAELVADWAARALQSDGIYCTVRFVDRHEITELNHQFRQKESATNVLSFESGIPPEFADGFLGDIVICVPVVIDEAIAQDKARNEHFAHMVIHGVLHLRGFDHIESEEAKKMEQLETQLLALLGIDCPYIDCPGDNTSSHG